MQYAFIDLEKAYDRVPKEELWECLRLAETSECYIRIIKEMYDGAQRRSSRPPNPPIGGGPGQLWGPKLV